MKVIFVNWTKPFHSKDKFKGHKKDISNHNTTAKHYNLPEYEILIQKLAFKNAKKYLNLPIKLYTDNEGLAFYENNNMLSDIDEVDTTLLETINSSDIDSSLFWTSGKVHAICNEPSPSIFLDLDFIVRSSLPESYLDYDLVCPHWEVTRKEFHLNLSQAKYISFEKFNNCLDMLMPNTSFLYIKDSRIKEKYLELHREIVSKQYKEAPEWLWLVPDQHILGFTLRDLEANVTALEDKAFIQYPEDYQFSHLAGYNPRWMYLNKYTKPTMEYEHIWFDKISLKLNEVYRQQKVELWKNELET